MDTKFYNDLKIGQTILDEMLERKLVSPFIYEGLKDVSDATILQEAKGFERIDDNFFNWSGVKHSLEQFDQLYNDPNIRMIKQFADKIGWPPTSGDMDNNEKAWRATFKRFAEKLNQEYNKNYATSWEQRKQRVTGGRATKSSLGGMKATGSPPDRYVQPGQPGQKNRQIEAINAEDLLPGVFYTDITRIPRSNHAKFWKFWDRQISSVPTEKAGLLGRKWEKSFIFGFEIAGTKGFGYEIWYNSIDSTFTLYDSKANDVTNERYDTLQGATRALFNTVTTDSRADIDYRIATSPTAQSMFKAVSSNIDPMIQKFQQMEMKDQKEFNRALETIMKDWTNDEKERFKEEYTPVRFSNKSIMDAAERYTAAFKTLKEHLPETQKEIRDLAFTGTIDAFEKEVRETLRKYTEYSTSAPPAQGGRIDPYIQPERRTGAKRREVEGKEEKEPHEADISYLSPQERKRYEEDRHNRERNNKTPKTGIRATRDLDDSKLIRDTNKRTKREDTLLDLADMTALFGVSAKDAIASVFKLAKAAGPEYVKKANNIFDGTKHQSSDALENLVIQFVQRVSNAVPINLHDHLPEEMLRHLQPGQVKEQASQQVKAIRLSMFEEIASFAKEDDAIKRFRNVLNRSTRDYERIFIDTAKYIVREQFNLSPKGVHVNELDSLYNQRKTKEPWERTVGVDPTTNEQIGQTEKRFVEAIVNILNDAKRSSPRSPVRSQGNGRVSAAVQDSVDEDLKLFMNVRSEAVQQLEERDRFSPEQRDHVIDVERNHNFSIVKSLRKTAEKETANQRQIQMFVNQNLLKVYHQSKIKRSDMQRWWESKLPRLFGDVNIMTPHMLEKKRGWDASFISGFSLKERVNLEIWYVTEPNPDHKSRHKTISSFYIFDATALKLIEKHIPHLRHAQSVIAQKIGLLERTI